MIIHNNIHQILVDISSEQGWNEESQILHLCGFLCFSARHIDLLESQGHMERTFRAYLQEVADEENAGVEATCEVCDAPCDYHSELCLCLNCKIEAAST